jgi:hypothetical protein
MADIDSVRQQMMEELERKIRSDGRLGSIRNKIQNGDYSEAGQYGTRCGELLSEVIRQNMTEDLFQECDVDGLASMLLPVIEKETEYVSNAVAAAQRSQNQETGIGIKPIKTDFDVSQYYNIFGKMQAYDSYDEAAWLLDEPIVQDSLKTVDESLRENAEFQYKAGLRTCVIREVEPDCCEFCAERAGTYYYPDVPDMVFERHNDCRCEIRIETEKDESYAKDRSIFREAYTRNSYNQSSNGVLNHKLKYTLNPQLFAARTGADRAKDFGDTWQKASIQEVIDKFVKGAIPSEVNLRGKRTYQIEGGRYQIVEDVNGHYFRILDTSRPGKSNKRKYVDLNGNDMNNITVNGKTRGRSDDEFEAVTHFLILEYYGE